MPGKDMSEELKKLVEQLGRALEETIRDSGRIRGIMERIEEAGQDSGITLAILLGLRAQNREIQRIVYGPEKGKDRKVSPRRISAFDRRFLGALRIQLPD